MLCIQLCYASLYISDTETCFEAMFYDTLSIFLWKFCNISVGLYSYVGVYILFMYIQYNATAEIHSKHTVTSTAL